MPLLHCLPDILNEAEDPEALLVQRYFHCLLWRGQALILAPGATDEPEYKRPLVLRRPRHGVDV